MRCNNCGAETIWLNEIEKENYDESFNKAVRDQFESREREVIWDRSIMNVLVKNTIVSIDLSCGDVLRIVKT